MSSAWGLVEYTADQIQFCHNRYCKFCDCSNNVHSTVAMVTLEDTPPFVQGQIMEAFSANTNTENALHPVTHTWNVERSTSEKMRNRLNLPSNVNSLWFFLDCQVDAFISKGNYISDTNTSDWATELALCWEPDWRQYYFIELDVLKRYPLNMTHSIPSQEKYKINPRRSTCHYFIDVKCYAGYGSL